MSMVEQPKAAPRSGKRPSDAISISEDEEPSLKTTRSESRPRTRSSLNSQITTEARGWKGWEKIACNRRETDQNVAIKKDDGLGQRAPVLNTTQKHCDGFRGLRYWRRREGKFWTHELYRGANEEKVKIHYCKTRAESERIAALLVNEPILGFDMEWQSHDGRGIKNNISLIQLACEDKIALFHVALHEGRTVSKLLAPTLRKILESPSIIKTGVAILRADGRRLQKYMRLDPRGLLELSHLHKLVKYHGSQPEKVNKQLVSLANQVFEHLGKPLFKGKVRVSDWTKPLDSDQIKYSAADAYAGFRLFHAMEMKRMKLVPIPPRPAFAELDLPINLSNEANPAVEDGGKPLEAIPANILNSPPNPSNVQLSQLSEPTAPSSVSVITLGNDPAKKRAILALRALRIRLSKAIDVNASLIASDATLVELAAKRPRAQADIESVLGYEKFSHVASQKGIDLVEFLNKFEAKKVQ